MESMTSFVKGGIEIETEMDRHSVRCDDVDEIESWNKIEGPRHSVRSDDDHHHNKGEFEGGKTRHRKSEKQKAPAGCPKCRRRRDRRRARTEKPPLPEGCGYLTVASGVDDNGHYYEARSDLVGYMSCLRCGMDGDHWDPYCPNPINDPPESDETAAARLSWKYILRDFNTKHQIDKEIETHKGGIEIEKNRIDDNSVRGSFKPPRLEDTISSDDLLAADDKEIETHKGEVSKTTHRKSVKQKAPASCPKYRRRRARTEKPPLPKGYGYLTVSSGVDKNGHYHELRGDRAYYMSCLRCGMEGDHWDPYCPNPINDPPESKESGAVCLTWKYILRDFNPKPQIDKEIETQGGIEIERHHIDDNSGRGSFKRPRLEDTISSDDLLAADDKEIETHTGEGGKTRHRKSEKQKAPASCPKCRRRRRRDRRRARTEKPPLPEGCGYLCLESGVDADGHYYEVLSNLVGYMSCLRCGVDGDHWDPYCPNPINDPPESEATAAARLSWKYILRDFNPKSH